MLEAGTYVDDRYEIVSKIGSGGMSDVYKAKDQTLGRFVAIKVLKQEFSEDVNFVTKFRTEAQSAAGLEHPNIVNIYDVGSENGMHFIVMEYVEGITLKTYIEKKGQLAFKEAVSIAIQVGRGIEAAHSKNIIHRDIKPQNIMISHEGKVKVTDFGIARAASVNTISTDVMGSVHYASPEQTRNGFVDGKSDIYSLGVVMYEMVTGRVPFDGETTVAVAIQHLQEEMVPPSTYAPNIPISLERIILKCTQKNPDRRYESMTALLTDLRKALITPDEDFVVIAPLGVQGKTRIIGEEDVNLIRKNVESVRNVEPEAAYKNTEEAEEYEEQEEDYEEEDDDDDYDDGELNPKMEKAITIMGIVAAIIIVAIIIAILGNLFGIFGGKGGSSNTGTASTETESVAAAGDAATMINIQGMTVEEATTELNKLGLGLRRTGTEASEEYAEGQIVTQSVATGETVELHTTIEVTVSSGVGSIQIESVVGKDADSASNALATAGFVVSKEFNYSEKVAQGTVISQKPEAGSLGKPGDTITIVISQGTQAITVPNVVGMDEEAGKAALADKGLNCDSTATSYSDTAAAGVIIQQSVEGGKQVQAGSVVSITVSLGAAPAGTPTDTPTTDTPAAPAAPAATYKLSVGIDLPKNADGSVNQTVGSVDVILKDANGSTITSWLSVGVSSFGAEGRYWVNQGGITTPNGSIDLVWYDTSGNALNTQTENINFTQE